MLKNINKNLTIIFFLHLIMKCIFKKLIILHYLHVMINNVMKIILKLSLGIENCNYMIIYTIQKFLQKLHWPNF